jgi:hypothetical protein
VNDLERDVREMFRRHEPDVAGPVLAPARLVGHVRRRQSAVVSTIAAAVASLVALAVGLSSILTADRWTPIAPTPTEGPLALDRPAPPLGTITLGDLMLRVPDGWFLNASGIEAGDIPQPRLGPVVWLSNFAPPLTNDDPCTGMREDGAILVIDPASGVGNRPAWPVDLAPASDPGLRCGSSEAEASWSWNNHGVAAMAAFGRAVSDADRRALENAFASLAPVAGADPFDPSAYCPPHGVNASQIIAAGALNGSPWTALVTPTCPGIGVATGRGQSTIGRSLFEGIGDPETLHAAVTTGRGNTFVFGVVPNDAARVVVDPAGAPKISAAVAPLGEMQAFAAAIGGLRTGTITSFDASGAVLGTFHFSFRRALTTF